ncbi:MAG TPA: cation diffusion facilitator family transporter [Gemmatimonadaceae bacterium]|nr:cation diffusion facilitator family transporter [Gemmatimonadaceae bacterium]
MAHSHAGHHHGPGGHGALHSHVAHGDSGRGHVRKLRLALAVTIIVLVAEVVGGILSNSLALLADAGHMLTDVAALSLSLFVSWFSTRPETPRRTYGYVRLEILAAFVNGGALLVISAFIAWEAFARLRAPEPVGGGLMLVIALVGLLSNIVAAVTLHGASDASLNVRGAYLHVLGDLLGSVGTVLAAVIIRFTGWLPADPLVSLVVTLLIVRGAWRLVREAVDVMLESTPAHISLGGVRAQIEAIPGVESVHDLHVWTVTSGVVAISAHAIVREPDRQQHVLEHVHDVMRLFGIQHVTIQLESREMYEREKHLHA